MCVSPKHLKSISGVYRWLAFIGFLTRDPSLIYGILIHAINCAIFFFLFNRYCSTSSHIEKSQSDPHTLTKTHLSHLCGAIKKVILIC